MNLSRSALVLLFLPAFLAAQAPEPTTGTLNLVPSGAAAEQAALTTAIQEANGSPVDLVRALEQHLSKYPDSPRRADIEASLYKTATDTNDLLRIVRYGERMLTRQPENEMEILDRVARALLGLGDDDSVRKALIHAKRYEAAVETMRGRPPEGHTTAAQWADIAERAFARAAILDARANGNLGNAEEAVNQAKRSWIAFPSAEAAHEAARWLEKTGRNADAIDYYADASTVEDARSPWADRDRDRKLATALYIKLHGSADGLGDLFMQAWDRSAEAMHNRTARYQAMDPNYGVTDTFAFKLPAVDVDPAAAPPPLGMANLKGKTVVVDFWATWCLPCLAQHPLIEKVKQRYAKSADVVFLSLDTDDDHALVAPFLQKQNWQQRVYLEAGLAQVLNVNALPTILVIGPSGKIFSRMAGLDPNLFEQMLTTRIDEARAAAGK